MLYGAGQLFFFLDSGPLSDFVKYDVHLRLNVLTAQLILRFEFSRSNMLLL